MLAVSEAAKEITRTEILARFRGAGLKATPQRLAIYRALVRMKDHPSPEGLYKAVRPAMPSLSLGTVYKALDALEQAGLVGQVSQLGELKRYEGNLDPHHHLVCTECRRIIDVHLEDEPAKPRARAFPGFKVERVHIQLLGVCEECFER